MPLKHSSNDRDSTDFVTQVAHLATGISGCSLCKIDYDQTAYHDVLFEAYQVNRPGDLAQWLPARKQQFLAGRIAASLSLPQAYSDTSPQHHQPHIGIGKYREPIWPGNLTGSISHSDTSSIAATMIQRAKQAFLGVDIQAIIDAQTQSQISPSVLTWHDEVLLDQPPAHFSEAQLFTLIFSAKESFFKAAFKSVGAYFDFDAVSVTELKEDSPLLTLKTNMHLSDVLPEGETVTISYQFVDATFQQVITICHWEL